jgi:surfeit locus 1 family protein
MHALARRSARAATDGLRRRHATVARSMASEGGQRGDGGGASTTTTGLMDAILLLPCALTGGLGAWQMTRREEKTRAIDARARALDSTVNAGKAVVGRDGVVEYARRLVRGELDASKTIRVGPRARSVCGVTVPGGLIVTPVRLWDGDRRSGGGWFGSKGKGGGDGEAKTVLLIRGWAPDSWTDADACVKTEGVAKESERPGRFTPDNSPGESRWYWLDAPAIAEACGLARDTPLIQAVAESEASRAGPDGEPKYPSASTKDELMTFPVSPEQHLGYAVTWFALSAFTGAMAVVRMRRRVGHRI